MAFAIESRSPISANSVPEYLFEVGSVLFKA